MKIKIIISVLSIFLFANATLAADNCYEFIQQEQGISIAITVSGLETRALLNTSLMPIWMSRTLADKLSLEIEAAPAGGGRRGSMPRLDSVNDVPIEVFDQSMNMDQMFVRDIPGEMIGLSVLNFKELLVQIDYPQSNICFLPRASMDLEGAQNINMRSATTGAPAIEVSLNAGATVWLELQIDSPAALSIDYQLARDLNFIDEVDATGQHASLTATAETLQLGPFDLGNIAVAFPAEATRKRQMSRGVMRATSGRRGVETHGAVGHEIFKHFVLTIDFKEEHMHIWAP
ncbi:MAG: hypothetical protein COC19_04760 [SAR86 cluster bacterium]|uniref:Uncharacterized protein n=1 Tax=SAR86 cluster bacterium TaxID=2030880 RepID=A0A2A4MPA1_9GAMM|nr:MAG: hypothetical protein COC19_04760 [SAR86 cluster bacterium]